MDALITIDMKQLAKDILDSSPVDITLAEVFIDNKGEGKYRAKRLIEEAVNKEIEKLGDKFIISNTEMEQVCEDVCLFVTREAYVRLHRIMSMNLNSEQKKRLNDPMLTYEVENEEEYIKKVNYHD